MGNDDAPPPPIVPSHYSADQPISSLILKPDSSARSLDQDELDKTIANWRLNCFLSAAQIFLKSNACLQRKLEFDDVKPRLLGHWG